MLLVGINLFAGVLVLAGLALMFRQRDLRVLYCALRHREKPASRCGEPEGGEMTAVVRMFGMMIVAFSFTIAAFANLIAYYSAHA